MKLPISRPVIAIGTNAEPTSRRSSMLTSVLCGQTQAGSKLERTLRQVLEYFAESTRVFAAEYDSTRRTAHLRLAVRRPMRCAHVRLLVHAPPSLSSGPVRGVPCARAPSWGPPPSPLPSPHDIYPTAQRHNSVSHPNRRTGRCKCGNISDKSSHQY